MERRKQARHALNRPCKVHHPDSGRYWPAVTCDCSGTGLLMSVDASRDLLPGDRVVVYIAWSSRALLSKNEGVHAEVKRCLPRQDGRQLVGVQFAEELAGFGTQAAAA